MDSEGAASPRRVAEAEKEGGSKALPLLDGTENRKGGKEGVKKKEKEEREEEEGGREGGGDWLPSAKEDGGGGEGEPRLLLRCLSEITARTRFLALKGLFCDKKEKKHSLLFFAKSKLYMYVMYTE